MNTFACFQGGLALIAFSAVVPDGRGGEPVLLDIFRATAPGVTVCTDREAPAGRCLAVDLRGPGGQACRTTTPLLDPGVYEAIARVKLSAIGTKATSGLNWTLSTDGAGQAVKALDILRIEKAQAYQDIACRFTVPQRGAAGVTLDWRRGEGKVGGQDDSRLQAAELKDIPEAPDEGLALIGGKAPPPRDPAADLEAGPSLAAIDYLNMAVAAVWVRSLGDADLSRLEVDRIRYRPGEAPCVNVEVHNYAPRARTFEVVTEFVHGLDSLMPVDRRPLPVPAGSQAAFSVTGPRVEQPWGYAVRARLAENGTECARAEDYFTVHSNLWAVMIPGRMPAQSTRGVTPENARATAIANQRHYGNLVEHFVWAPDDFGDFTPDTEYWWSGQACYAGSVTGTHLMIDEGHKMGISYALYANLWGGGGPPAFELIRRHPDWGRPSFYNTDWMERWDRNLAGTGQGPGMHVWIACVNNYTNPAPFHHHAREIIATRRRFGWDAIRYDSYSAIQRDDPVLRLVKADVEKEEPDIQWGYNTIVPGPSTLYPDAFRELCRRGGLIMDEGSRGYHESQAPYEALARRILLWSEATRRFGGHFTAIGQDKFHLNDLLYQYIFWLAGNTHPWFGDWGEGGVANYRQFATRFAGLIFNLAATPVPEASRWIDVGSATNSLFLFPHYVRQLDLGAGRRQLILQFINAPAAACVYADDNNLLPPPREPFPVTVKLPGPATVRGVWHLTAEYELTQKPIPFTRRESTLAFTAPRLRFWNLAVLDIEDAGPEFACWSPKPDRPE